MPKVTPEPFVRPELPNSPSGNPWRQLPLPLRRRVKADAMSKGERIHQWLERACQNELDRGKLSAVIEKIHAYVNDHWEECGTELFPLVTDARELLKDTEAKP